MVVGDRFPAGHTRQHALAPTGEACEEMGLNKPFGHQKVGLHGQPVKHKTPTRGELPHVNQVGIVVAVVDHYFLVLYYIVSELLLQLLPGGGPVQAGGYEDCYVGPWVLKADFGQDLGHDDPAWHGPGMI